MISYDEDYAETLLSSIWADTVMFVAEQTFEGENLKTLNDIIERLTIIKQNSLKGKI